MRAYLEIVLDSFRQAFSSGVLPFCLAAITLVLLALAPLGYDERAATLIESRSDLMRGAELVGRLRLAAAADEPSPGKRVWSLFTDEQRAELAKLKRDSENPFRDLETIRGALNAVIQEQDVYEQAAFRNTWLNRETRDLIDRPFDELTEQEQLRRNRVLLQAAFPNHMLPLPPQEIRLNYLGMDFPLSIAGQRFDKARFQTLLEQFVLPGIMSFLIGVVAMLVALLVTSPVIPQVFETGSLHLLLSKPINRMMMFLAKFLGGCAFILINVTYLLVGLWLLVGFRFDNWNYGLLLCIPIFLFLFMIYYSVSALSGVIWKNAIVCVVATILLWGSCFVVGMVNNIMKSVYQEHRYTHVTRADGQLVVSDERNEIALWDSVQQEWEPIFQGQRRFPLSAPPVYDPQTKRLIAVQGLRGAPGRFAFAVPAKLVTASADSEWQRTEGPDLPQGSAVALLEPSGGVLSIGTRGIRRLPPGDWDQEPPKVAGFQLPKQLGALLGNSGFKNAGPENLSFEYPMHAAGDATRQTLAIYTRGQLILMERQEDGSYRERARREMDGEASQAGAVAMAGSSVLLARETSGLEVFDAGTLESRYALNTSDVRPRYLAGSPDGRWFACVTHRGTLWLADNREQKFVRGPASGVTGANFQDGVLLAVRDREVLEVDLEKMTSSVLVPMRPSNWEWIYLYVVRPLYSVFPQPGELDNTVQYVLSKDDAVSTGIFQGEAQELASREIRISPWAPVRSSSLFILVMLTIGCLYVARHEF